MDSAVNEQARYKKYFIYKFCINIIIINIIAIIVMIMNRWDVSALLTDCSGQQQRTENMCTEILDDESVAFGIIRGRSNWYPSLSFSVTSLNRQTNTIYIYVHICAYMCTHRSKNIFQSASIEGTKGFGVDANRLENIWSFMCRWTAVILASATTALEPVLAARFVGDGGGGNILWIALWLCELLPLSLLPPPPPIACWRVRPRETETMKRQLQTFQRSNIRIHTPPLP